MITPPTLTPHCLLIDKVRSRTACVRACDGQVDRREVGRLDGCGSETIMPRACAHESTYRLYLNLRPAHGTGSLRNRADWEDMIRWASRYQAKSNI